MQQEDALGPALFCLPLRLVLTRVWEEYKSQGVEAYVYLDDITIAADEMSPGTVGVDSEGHAPQLGQDGYLGPEGTRTHAGRYISLLAGVGVRVADDGVIKVVGVPVGSDEFVIESATGIVDGRAEQLARMPPRMPDNQAANLIVTGFMVQRTAYVERAMDPNCPCQLEDGQIMAQCGCSKTFSSVLGQRRNCRSSRRGAW